ncbi:aldose 1-epimerase family protein [Terrarubrum flagellatum]|uniref:aldose 1-epimerase family protein n=1 Tax=Terrirubrum flagellatum TaxID=2895980 RepID=UPI003145069D
MYARVASENVVRLASGDATALLSLRGAEPLVWRIGDRDYLWSGDPAWWDRCAPILFPVVGASAGGKVRVGGQSYPMPRHGFARDSQFSVVEARPDRARLRLTANENSRTHYPFDFTFDVVATLTPKTLSLAFEIGNAGEAAMPYSLGFHPAFPWPFDGGDGGGHSVEFEREEKASVSDITRDGLIGAGQRPVPLKGTVLPLAHDLFAHDALCFFDARSKVLKFRSPRGAAVAMEMEDFPHLALWTKPGAPFLSMECWTGHADLDGFSGELSQRASGRSLAPGGKARHAVTMRVADAA